MKKLIGLLSVLVLFVGCEPQKIDLSRPIKYKPVPGQATMPAENMHGYLYSLQDGHSTVAYNTSLFVDQDGNIWLDLAQQIYDTEMYSVKDSHPYTMAVHKKDGKYEVVVMNDKYKWHINKDIEYYPNLVPVMKLTMKKLVVIEPSMTPVEPGPAPQ